MRVPLFVLVAFLVVGCSSSSKPVSVAHPPAPEPVVDPWIVGTNDPGAAEPALLWNGQIGLRLDRFAGMQASDTAALFSIDEYETEGEEKIRSLVSPVRVILDEASNEFQPRNVSGYEQRLDLRNGLLTTRWEQDLPSEGKGGRASILCETVMHPDQRVIAQRWSVRPTRDASLALGPDPNIGGSALRDLPKLGENDALFAADRLGERPIAWRVRSREIKGGSSKPGTEYVAEAIWSFGESEDRLKLGATKIAPPIAPPTFNEVLASARAVWKKRWQTDIEIDGPVADQQAVRSFLFYLRSAIHPKGTMSVSPFALSNTQYNGHIFWDADIWIFPVLALIDPQAAKEISDYRLRMEKGARQHASGGNSPSPTMVQYPWESSVTGKETVPGPSQKELHITGSVLWSLTWAAELGLADPARVESLGRAADQMYFEKASVEGPQGREIRDVMSPDENHIGDNDLYTNLLANWLHNRYGSGARGADAWKRQTYKLPKDETSFLTYDDDPIRGYKQAAAVLSIFPLQFPPAEEQARAMMDRFSEKTIKNGPAMTDSIHSVIWSRLGEKEKAYATWRASWEPFTQHPLMLFAEKRNRGKTYFTTGAGGALQSVLFGFLGMRLDWQKEPGSAWSRKLREDAWLSVKPNLPTEWKSVKFRNFSAAGRRYTLTVSPNAVQVVPGG